MLKNNNTNTTTSDTIQRNLTPIPFDYFEFIKLTNHQKKKNNSRNQNEDMERHVSLSTNHMFVNYKTDERLRLYEYVIERSKLDNYPFGSESTWNDHAFLDFDKSDTDNKNNDLRIKGKILKL